MRIDAPAGEAQSGSGDAVAGEAADSNERNDERLKSAQSGSGDAAVDDAADVDERDDERLEAALSDLLRSSSSTTLYPPLDSTDAADRVADHARAANADRAAVAALSVPLASRAAGDEPPLPALAQLLTEQTAPTALRSAANAVPRTAVADGGVEVQHRAQLAHFVGAAQRWLELVNGASADSWRELLQRTRLRQDAIIDVCFRSTSRRPAHYVAVDDNLRAIVLAVRSTKSISDLMVDYDYEPTSFLSGAGSSEQRVSPAARSLTAARRQRTPAWCALRAGLWRTWRPSSCFCATSIRSTRCGCSATRSAQASRRWRACCCARTTS